MSHITLAQRYEIAALHRIGKTQQYIGATLGVHKTSICRELKRNCDERSGVYKAALAERKCRQRHWDKPKKIRLTQDVRATVEKYIRKDYSPEQVSGYCKKEGIDCVSPETIYLLVWKDKKAKGDLFKHLRRRGRKNKKRGDPTAGRGLIKDRVGIEKRPAQVELKKTFGDLEADTIVGKNHEGALVTINDRASGMLKMKRTTTREASEVSAAMNELLEDWLPYIRTITSDNGKEFAGHKDVAEACQIDFYFANPYCSWERGANENLNGLVRQYFPKKTDFSSITDKQVADVMEKLNNRPRKRFNFETPLEVMEKLLFNTEVAFIT
jgi:IS30 family transposase